MSKLLKMHEKWMKIALKEAHKAQDMGEVPIGAVIVSDSGELLAKAHNLKESVSDPTGHAEILAIKKAAQKTASWRLTDATIYVTLQPCMMCAGAITQARLKHLVFGASDPKADCTHSIPFKEGVLKDECAKILTNFFKAKR